jgi:spore germination protein GerM
VTRRLLVLLAGLALLVVAGCDVPTNDQPVELSGPFSRLDTTTTTSTTSPQVDGREAIVYLLRTEGGATVLVSVPRRVGSDGGVQENLRNLFSQPPAGDGPESGLTTAIPAGATLLSAERSAVDGDRLIVDVRGLFGDQGPQGVTLRNALAQIVWTATHPTTGFNEVVFRNDGQPADALVDNLETTGDAVTKQDYARSIT